MKDKKVWTHVGLASAPSTALTGMEEGLHLSGFLSSLKKKNEYNYVRILVLFG